VPLDYAGASIWVTTYMMAGYALGHLGLTLDSTQDNFRLFEWLLFAAFVTWVIILAASARRLLRQRRLALADASEEHSAAS
jgi:membrane protein DedA with SNARE-associated domain